ncbi:hypothetical protein MKX03_018836 [Papaver bracteatum]|nr:hypothetical protein MKX03_018836 [Papaver bracteatum]
MRLFSLMTSDYNIEPRLEHYCCVVDLLGRAGRLKEAENFIDGMMLEPDWIIWGSLLRSCWVAEKLLRLDPDQITPYVIMSNIYAAVRKWGKVGEVRKKLRSMKVKKDPGCSWVEVKNTPHVFQHRMLNSSIMH